MVGCLLSQRQEDLLIHALYAKAIITALWVIDQDDFVKFTPVQGLHHVHNLGRSLELALRVLASEDLPPQKPI
jgi:hypothetical protein